MKLSEFTRLLDQLPAGAEVRSTSSRSMRVTNDGQHIADLDLDHGLIRVPPATPGLCEMCWDHLCGDCQENLARSSP